MFLIEQIRTEKIKEDADYEGVRIHLPYKMDTIKGYLSIDIGFGDKIVHGPIAIDFPVLLDMPSPHIFVYSLESAVAEKFEAIVKLNFLTSRMKDFYDILFVAERNQFKSANLKKALSVTFAKRETDIEERHLIYQDNFKSNEQKHIQWLSFLERNKLTKVYNFSKTIELIQVFIEPIFSSKALIWKPAKFNWE